MDLPELPLRTKSVGELFRTKSFGELLRIRKIFRKYPDDIEEDFPFYVGPYETIEEVLTQGLNDRNPDIICYLKRKGLISDLGHYSGVDLSTNLAARKEKQAPKFDTSSDCSYDFLPRRNIKESISTILREEETSQLEREDATPASKNKTSKKREDPIKALREKAAKLYRCGFRNNEKGNFAKAKKYLVESLELYRQLPNINLAPIHYNIGFALCGLGRRTEAIPHYEYALEHNGILEDYKETVQKYIDDFRASKQKEKKAANLPKHKKKKAVKKKPDPDSRKIFSEKTEQPSHDEETYEDFESRIEPHESHPEIRTEFSGSASTNIEYKLSSSGGNEAGCNDNNPLDDLEDALYVLIGIPVIETIKIIGEAYRLVSYTVKRIHRYLQRQDFFKIEKMNAKRDFRKTIEYAVNALNKGHVLSEPEVGLACFHAGYAYSKLGVRRKAADAYMKAIRKRGVPPEHRQKVIDYVEGKR